jgi:hypothetical protein
MAKPHGHEPPAARGGGARRGGAPVEPPAEGAPQRGQRGQRGRREPEEPRSQREPHVRRGMAPGAAVAAPEEAAPGGGRGRQLLGMGLAGVVVVLLVASARLEARAPWSYDEYFHFGMARELRLHFPLRSFPWTPFSAMAEHFADGVPLFHAALMPLAGLSIEAAGAAAVVLGQVFVLACLGAALWRMGVRHAWAYMLGLAALGSLFTMRLDMCRPQLLLIGFSLLVVGLLVTGARGWVLALTAALFSLAHAGGWIAILYAAAWAAAGWLLPRSGAAKADAASGGRTPGASAVRRVTSPAEKTAAASAASPSAASAASPVEAPRASWRARFGPALLPLLWVAGGWLAGQLVHPNFPNNLRLMALVNLEVPFEASPAGNAALRSQIGEELTPPGLAILAEQWPIFLAPLAAAVTLLRQRRLRTRATLTTALLALAFLALGAVLLRRMLELGAPLGLLALAALAVERRRQGLGGLLGSWTAWAAAGALLLCTLWTAVTVRSYGFGKVSQPEEMARWLGEHARPGERVFTAQWADSSPLFYAAPRLQSLVALDPTLFYVKDPRLFQVYVDVVQGRRPDAARVIRERFGARWVTLWKNPVYERLAEQLVATPGVTLAYRDPYYVVADLGAAR